MLMELSNELILKDIDEYRQRINEAKVKLSSLSSGFLPYTAYVKREAVRQELEAEITHVKQLLTYATEALNEQGGV